MQSNIGSSCSSCNGGRDWEPEWSGVGSKPSVLPRSSPRRELGSFFLPRQGNGTLQQGIPEGWSNWSAQVHVYQSTMFDYVWLCLYMFVSFVTCVCLVYFAHGTKWKRNCKKNKKALLFRSCSPLFERCTESREQRPLWFIRCSMT